MKLVFNEQMKHRVVGVFVIIAIASIFLPALMKQSNYRFDDSMNVAVRLPKHPAPPNVQVPDEKKLFAAIKVPKVKLNPLPQAPQVQTVKAEPINEIASVATQVVELESVIKPVAISQASKNTPAKPAPKVVATVTKKKPVVAKTIKTGVYAVQIATFSQEKNAAILLHKLKEKGYKASMHKFASKQGNLFKVLVGDLNRKEEAAHLQKQLADSLRLNGFIVKKEVS